MVLSATVRQLRRGRRVQAVLLLLASSCGALAHIDNNLRHALDLSSRVVHSGVDDFHLGAVGLDLHRVYSSEQGDIGTLTLQPYLLRIDSARNAPPLFDDGDDWALQWRIANFNYTGLGHGRFNVRLGHFEVPFGLEQVEQTNGTLYQLNSPAALGLKADWGASINGTLESFEYEAGYLLGTGNDISGTEGGYWAGRIGTRSERRLRLGVSFMGGEQAEPVIVERRRLGFDLTLRLPHGFDLAYELAAGEDEDASVNHQLAQVLWRDRREHWYWHLQWRQSQQKPDRGSDRRAGLTGGVRLEPNPHWSFSAALERDLHAFEGMKEDTRWLAQIRYRL